MNAVKSDSIKIISITNGNADIREIPKLSPYFDHHVSAGIAGTKNHRLTYMSSLTVLMITTHQLRKS